MTTPPAIRVNDPAELLALIAYQLGFIPARSMVFLGIRGDGTAGMAARVDLSAVATPDAGDDLVDEIAAHLVADDAQQVLIVVYSETSHDHLADHPYVTGLLPTVARRLPWPDATWWHVGPTSFTRLDPERGPGHPRRLSDLEATQVATAMVVAGRRIVATREELAALPRVDAEARSAARGAAERARAIRDARSTTGIEAWRSGQSQRWRRLLTAGREGTGLTPEELGRMGVALGDIDVRDQIISAAVQGRPEALGAPGWREAAAQVLKPAGPAPDRRLLGPVVAVIEAIAAHVAGKERESALVLLGWFAWWCGDNAKAHVHFQRCLAGDPGHRLALLMHEVLRVGHPPGWVLGARSGSNFRGTAGNSWGTAGNTAR